MLGYIKKGDIWYPEKNLETVLKTEGCIVANDIQDAIDHLNRDYLPNFIIAYKYNYYRNEGELIYQMEEPALRQDMTFFEALRIMKESGEKVKVVDWDQNSKWENEIGDKNFHDFGVCKNSLEFEYNPEKARKRAKYPSRLVKPRKNYIPAWEFVDLKNSLDNAFRIAVWDCYGFNDKRLGISIIQIHGDERKWAIGNLILRIIEPFNTWFGSYSYRKVAAFQEFKQKWKTEQPKSAKSLGISEKFFDFMEQEVLIRAPVNKKFKGKKVIRNDKSYNV